MKTTSKSGVYRSKPKNTSNGVCLEITKYSFKTALKSLRLEKWINLLTILSVSIGLTIFCAFIIINSNMSSALQRWAKSFGVVVYLNEDINKEGEDKSDLKIVVIAG